MTLDEIATAALHLPREDQVSLYSIIVKSLKNTDDIEEKVYVFCWNYPKHTYKETATEFGLTPAKVSKIVHRYRKKHYSHLKRCDWPFPESKQWLYTYD